MDSLNTYGGSYDVYKDIQARTGGEIYIGVVGPVRTGKSTFIKRFMDLLVIPNIDDVHSRERAVDELPLISQGKMITTVEPKFIPKEAAKMYINDDIEVSVRLIDCVGYMVQGATGHIVEDVERLVKTPWFDYEIPFTEAAELGTKKVINDHSTIGIVITTDGSFGELERESYEIPEKRTIEELQKLGKPFVVLVNSSKPHSDAAVNLALNLEESYGATAIPVNCEQLKKEDIRRIMEGLLSMFPISEIEFHMPKWVEMLSIEDDRKQEVVAAVKSMFHRLHRMRDVKQQNLKQDASGMVKFFKLEQIEMENGRVTIRLDIDDSYYYQMLSDLTGLPIQGEYQFMSAIRELSLKKKEFDKFAVACEEVGRKGYGIVTPNRKDIILDEPELIKHGNKFGVKVRATAPSISLIAANIQTEIAPIVGTEEQADDLIRYIKEGEPSDDGSIGSALIFGKSIGELVEEGILSKIRKMTEESQEKLQETLQKIINESSGGVVFIII